MALSNDFKTVMGTNLSTIINRSFKGVLALKDMIKGGNLASNKMPLRVQIEITDKCNLDCIMCNRLTRNIDYKLNNDISYDMFHDLIRIITPFYVTLNGLGEPLLHKQIDKIISLCRNKKITTSMPHNLSVAKGLNTLMTKTPPDIITFSIHGATKETFETISRKADFMACITSLRTFLTTADKRVVTCRVLCALQAKNLHEYKSMYELMIELGLLDNFCLVPVHDYGSCHGIIPTDSQKENVISQIKKDIESSQDKERIIFYQNWIDVIRHIKTHTSYDKEFGPCLIPWFSTHITARGDVLPCCYLTEQNYIMGNIFDTPFNLIWNNAKYQGFRKKLRESRGDLNGCNYCDRNDTSRIKKYRIAFLGKSLWKIP